ncbi:NADPH-dependent FMN reductase [Pseudomaricurvus sp.]|uniref:NADPH-dependent FMN reductase n=1 Tax=Pseudomaricurvus sp. TaxID=2004510 RepID=UPI003F6A7710
MSEYHVAMLVGSTRQGSLNQRLARAIEKLAPQSLKFNWVQMDDMPFYNADLEEDRPAAVKRFVKEIQAADAICIVTPEYNRSIPAVLKNAIDWGSKPPEDNVWNNKPIAMAGTSPGAAGTALAQSHLRQILPILGSHILPGEVYITFKSPDLIDENGTVNDDSVQGFIAGLPERFAEFIDTFSKR